MSALHQQVLAKSSLPTSRFLLLILCLFLSVQVAFSQQQESSIYGKVTDSLGNPLDLVNVTVVGTNIGTMTTRNGEYRLSFPASRRVVVNWSTIGYKNRSERVELNVGERKEINMVLSVEITSISEVEVYDRERRITTLTRIEPQSFKLFPTVNESLESLLVPIALGVSQRNEMSSQYTVRGGNFDENLVYVNDIEVHRPFLIRAGQQEGLSFINPNLVSSVLFSAGGFDAKYGDKMSSVLDIKYKRPTEFGGSATASFLGGAIDLEGTAKDKFTYLVGVRYKTTQYLLNTLEEEGEYNPAFTDIQTYLTYKPNSRWELAFLGNYASNSYRFVPETRSSDFGTIKTALNLTIYFDGMELDKFTTTFGALSAEYKLKDSLRLKFIASAFKSNEEERFDIQGQYYLNEVEKELGKENLGDSILNLGIGTFLHHARNYLTAYVFNFSHRGNYVFKHNNLQWGIQYQRELINDELKEWKMLDSAGYSIPYTGQQIGMEELIYAQNEMNSNRFTAFAQNNYSKRFANQSDIDITYGIRANYWDYTGQLLVSPRATIAYQPQWEKDVILRLSSGVYYQPAFYKELRKYSGEIYENNKAQRSIHFVAGADYNFEAWNRPFKLVAELYYKKLDNLVPYEIDNVRVRYYADQIANGYAAGIDMKVNGHFVKGVDSWASMSIMQTREDVQGDGHGYIPRPTDQLMNIGLFFQDYFPNNDSYKVHLNLLYASRLPFGPPHAERYQATLRTPSYKRVDIGFSKAIISENKFKERHIKHIKSVWLRAEVFNLLGVNNTVSYLWVKVVPNTINPVGDIPQMYAVPNRLTARRLNVRLTIDF